MQRDYISKMSEQGEAALIALAVFQQTVWGQPSEKCDKNGISLAKRW